MIFDQRKFFFFSIGTVLLMLAVVMMGWGQSANRIVTFSTDHSERTYTLQAGPRCQQNEYLVMTNPPHCAPVPWGPVPDSEYDIGLSVSTSPFFQLEVETADGSIVGGVFSTGQTWVAPIVARVCSIPRFRRNLRAALGGSALANGYLTACAKRLGSGYGN